MPEIITRKEARALGLKQYFTGKPCVHGHVSKRNVISKSCLGCQADRVNLVVAAQRLHAEMTRIDAKQKGLKRYFTGVPCSKGHIAERWMCSFRCVECSRIDSLNRLSDDPTRERDRVAALARYYKNKPAIRQQQRERKRRMAAALRALEELGIEV